MSVKKLDFDSIRQSKKSFTTNFNEVIQNIPNAFYLGVYIYLSSLPTDWKVNIKQLMGHFSSGREKIQRTLKWLNDNELIDYIRIRDENGKFIKDPVDNFNHCAIEVQEGLKFIENTIKNQQLNTTIPETRIMANKLYKKQPTILKNQSVEKPHCGFSSPTNTIINTNTKKSREAENQNPLSQIFKPNHENTRLCVQLKLNLEEELKSFDNRHRGEKTQYEFERWIKSSREYLDKRTPPSNQPIRTPFNEVKSTVPFWGPGHPGWEAVNSVKVKRMVS
jgi:hypothetical protein